MASLASPAPCICLCLILSPLAPQQATAEVAQRIEACPYSPSITARSESDEIKALLKPIPITAEWKDVPASTQKRLVQLADQLLLEFRLNWNVDALSREETSGLRQFKSKPHFVRN